MTLTASLSAAGRWLTDLLYPPRCLGCGRFGAPVCEPCGERLIPPPPAERCPYCAALWNGDGNCPRCYHWDALDGARCAYEMAGLARTLVHNLKYRGVRAVAPAMGHRISPLLDDHPFDAVVAVPLHRSRERHRGFNQSALLVSAAGRAPHPGLARTRSTRQQVGLGAAQRSANIRGAFAWHGEPVDGMRIALVDDVVTTGMTANECARVLKDHGAKEVIAVAFARASYDLQRGPSGAIA